VEQQLTGPLEKYLFTFSEVNREKTTSKSKDGIAYIFVELADDVKDKNVVWSKIKHGINTFKSSLPSGVLAVIANDNFADVASVLVTLESDDKTYRELDGLENAFYYTFSQTTIYSNNIVLTVFPASFVGEFRLGMALLLSARS
jgi:multidrug efflux pump subunit AcrB